MSIRSKLFLALLFFSALLVLVPAAFSYLSFSRGLQHYLGDRQHAWLDEVRVELESYYQQRHSWEQLGQERLWLLPLFQRNHDDRERPSWRLIKHLSLLDQHKRLLAGPPPKAHSVLIALKQQGQIIGWLAYPQTRQLRGIQEKRFQERQTQWLLLIGLFAIGLAALISWLLARHLVTPIESLSDSTRRLRHGEYHTRSKILRHDELGQLANNINQLAISLEDGKQARSRWLADLSHELRTPVAILQGEIQALVDGIRKVDAKRLASLEQEVAHLHKLLNDLHDLALADSGSLRYQLVPLDLLPLIKTTCAAFDTRLQEQQLSLDLSELEAHSSCQITGDATRLRQLLHNLLDNAVKYTDTGGQIRLQLTQTDKQIKLTLDDSKPGVAADLLPQLFDHLFRVDNSRNRARGGSGLGLAICQRIVQAHSGSLTAAQSSLGGLAITLTLPRLAE